jgi:DNA-binding CsgD family transcriptional regulator
LWLKILGEAVDLPPDVVGRLLPAYASHIGGRWREAADAWCELGCPYEQAIALSMGDETAQREALALFDRLGAAPAAQKLRRAMRESGVRRVPSGPRSARRNDPAGLTPRQNQVLKLLAEGLSNSQIAARLQMSPKTVEHHVGAVLAAFEAPSRLRAVQIARERGVLGGAGPI